jgi:hypothetical protein
MRDLGISLFVFTVACSSPQDQAPFEDGEPSPGQEGGVAGARDGGIGGSGRTDAGTGGKGGSAGTGGKSGTGGSAGTGGSTGTGGSAGTGGGPPHVVGACDGLGAVDQWEAVTPAGVAFVGSVAVDPVHAGTVYVGTGATSGTSGAAQGVRKSTDCGATWTNVSTGTNGSLFDSGTNYGIIVDWFDPAVLYSATLYGANLSLLKSTNSGVDWSILFPPGSDVANAQEWVFAQEFSMDPTDHAHVAVSFHVGCTGQYAPMCLGETRDSGATWHVFKGPLDGWGENARPFVIGSKALLFISYFGAYYTADSSAAVPIWEKIAPYGGHVHHASNGNYYLASYAGIYRSTDGGHAWTLIPNSPRGYTIKGDGQRLFVGGDVANNYQTALETKDTEWKALSAPSTPDAYITFSYDADHHVLYSANHTTGLLRMVTR